MYKLLYIVLFVAFWGGYLFAQDWRIFLIATSITIFLMIMVDDWRHR
jgi:hypothetical protein